MWRRRRDTPAGGEWQDVGMSGVQPSAIHATVPRSFNPLQQAV